VSGSLPGDKIMLALVEADLDGGATFAVPLPGATDATDLLSSAPTGVLSPLDDRSPLRFSSCHG
jgi:hypothetical protein